MGVLPDRSKKIVPKIYHDLMTDPASPIIDFYPRDFDLDMNGKKMEWEAVVKIPFIDEKRLLAAMAPRNNLLSDVEKARNEFGVTLKFTHDPNVDFVYPSSLVGVFNEISHCHCVENIFDLPTIEGLDYHVGLVDGVKLGEEALAGFPSLSNLPHNAALGFHGVSVFQQESRNESMVVTIEETETRTNIKAALANLGERVFVGYPFLQEGKVTHVSDELFDYFPSSDGSAQPIQKNHSPREIDDWHKKAERIENQYSRRLGILIGQVESLTHVEILKGLRKTDDGAMIKEYGIVPGIETDYASQAVVASVMSEDQRFLEKAAVPIEEEFPIGSKAFFLEESHFGRPAIIHSHLENRVEIQVSTLAAKEPAFSHHVVASAASHSRYTPSFRVAETLGLNGLVLSKITSAFNVTAMGSMRLNLGLNLKFEAKKLKVLGYSRRGDKGWEFSDKAIELISQYMIKFPEFFAGLARRPHSDGYEETDFFPPATASAKIKEMVAWLKSIEAKHFEKVPLDAEQLDSDIVAALESAADQVGVTQSATSLQKFKGVPRNALLKPSDAEHRLGDQRFVLGDRVVYIQDSGRVPIAARGTVVGISRTSRTVLLDILFDSAFMSGTDLGGRCSPFRGSTVPTSSVLNLSNKQVIAMSRAAAGKRPVPRVTPLQVNQGMGSANMGRGGAMYGAPGGRQLRESPAPPLLRGGYRGAATGTLNRRGGRGGAPQGPAQNFPMQNGQNGSEGSLPIRGGRGGTHQNGTNGGAHPSSRGGGTNAKQPAYNAVAPPPNMDIRGGRGGRGRGAHRGRGGAAQTVAPHARGRGGAAGAHGVTSQANGGGRGSGSGVQTVLEN